MKRIRHRINDLIGWMIILIACTATVLAVLWTTPLHVSHQIVLGAELARMPRSERLFSVFVGIAAATVIGLLRWPTKGNSDSNEDDNHAAFGEPVNPPEPMQLISETYRHATLHTHASAAADFIAQTFNARPRDPGRSISMSDQLTGLQQASANPNVSNSTSTVSATNMPPPPPAPDVAGALHDAFLLASSIVELKSRVILALVDAPDAGTDPGSIWRSDFNRIAALHGKIFPQSTTANTLYDPPGSDKLPYLYNADPDYPNTGIQPAADSSALSKFALFDVTRRAINCLTLLYVSPAQSLVPDVVAQIQQLLVSRVPDTATAGDAALDTAKQTLTDDITKFLDAWDGFLRENYYSGGQLPDNNTELIAYEAGRGMSSLSWGISCATVPLELAPPPALGAPPAADPFMPEWQKVFEDQSVILLQHQISALSAALDDAFYAAHKELKRPSDNEVLVAPNPDLPSQAILAVKNSIDYWQRTVAFIQHGPAVLRETKDNPAPSPAERNRNMRVALIEQANVWQSLTTGQNSLRAYTMENITQHIMEDVMADIQKGMGAGISEGVKQAEQMAVQLAKEAQEAIEVVGRSAAQGMESMFKSSVGALRPILIAAAVIIIAVFVVAVAAPANHTAASATGGAGVMGVITAILGYLGIGNLAAQKNTQQATVQSAKTAAQNGVANSGAANALLPSSSGGGSLLQRIEGAAQETGNMVLTAFENGYKQMRIELDGLGRSVGVTYPLLEFFTEHFTLEGDLNFLTGVIWNGTERAAEMKQVLRAAFGPLAMFINPDGDQKPPAGNLTAKQ